MNTAAAKLALLMPSGGQISAPLLLYGAPSAPTEATDKAYVDAKVGGIPDAPVNLTTTYGRANAAWVPVLPIGGGTMTGPIVLSGDPTAPLQPATQQYVLNQVGAYLKLSGGSMSGALTLQADPVGPLMASTKQYTDTKVPLAGGTMTGFLTLNADPQTALEAATKQYVDAHIPTGGGIADAPSDSTTYGRSNAAWVNVLPLAGGVLTGSLSGSGAGQVLDNFTIDMGTF